jgi:L-alanine-DL-glutamate epimerase-like enolase superfamily enzyme
LRESVAGLHELESALRSGALDVCQSSVIKFGGIEAVAQAAKLAGAHGVNYVPHCFYSARDSSHQCILPQPSLRMRHLSCSLAT